MPDDPAVVRSGAIPEPDGSDPAARAQRHAEELAARLARVAEEIADSEEQVARTYEASARLRPHAADRLRSGAEEARRFARHEREQGRRLRHEDPDAAG